MKKVKCKFKGHNIVAKHTTNIMLKEYECTECKQEFTTDGYGRMVKLTRYWKENNMLFKQYFKQRAAV